MKKLFFILALLVGGSQNFGTPLTPCNTQGHVTGDAIYCDIFYECDDNLYPQVISCPTYMLWNEDTGTCDFVTSPGASCTGMLYAFNREQTSKVQCSSSYDIIMPQGVAEVVVTSYYISGRDNYYLIYTYYKNDVKMYVYHVYGSTYRIPTYTITCSPSWGGTSCVATKCGEPTSY